jgi:hypothetical protein
VIVVMPWPAPPLLSNNRLSVHAKARAVRDIRHAAKLVGRTVERLHGQQAGPLRVRFVWTVTDNRTRDAGAPAPTLKAALDGLVDAGLIAADRWQNVPEESYRIELGTRPGCRIEIQPDHPTPADWSLTP